MNLYPDDHIKAEIKSRLTVADVMDTRAGSKTSCPHPDCPSRLKVDKHECHAKSDDRWLCYVCHRGGDVFDFLMARDNMTFAEAKRTLASRLGIAMRPPVERTEMLIKVVRAAHNYLFKVEPQKLEYLTGRGLPQNVLWRHQVGYLDLEGRALKASGVGREDLLKLGLIFPGRGGPDRQALGGRYIFPIRNTWGSLVQLKGRLDPNAPLEEDEKKSKSKPLVKQSNAAAAAGWPEVSHMNYLYLEETLQTARRRGELHLAEGEPDTLTFKVLGWEACGLQTCQGLFKHANKLKDIKRIYFWPDNDVASQKFLLKELFETLMRLDPAQTLYLCTPPALGGEGVKVDVNDLRNKYNLSVHDFEAIRNGAPEAMHVLIDAWGKQLNDPATRANLYQLLRVFPASRRSAYIGRLSAVSGKKPMLLAFAVDPDDATHESA